MELDELRKRLFTDRASHNVIKHVAAVSPISDARQHEDRPVREARAEHIAVEAPAAAPQANNQLAGSVDGFFEMTQKFRASMEELSGVLAPIENASQRAADTFETIRTLHDQLQRLADTFQSVKDFTEEVRRVGRKFEPMNALHTQLSSMAGAFSMQIKELAGSFETAKELHTRISKVAAALEPISGLENGLLDLAQKFALPEEKVSPEEAAA